MTTELIGTTLRTHLAQQFVESWTEPANTIYYTFAGKHTAFPGVSVPAPLDTVQTILYDAYDKMVFGKRIAPTDVSLMIPKVEWVANTVYNSYDSNTVVYNTNFYVAVNAASQYHIFKVLDNNSNSVSTVVPDFAQTGADDQYYSTADGYVWKYVYTLSSATWNKFSTNEFMPVTENANVSGNAVSGALDVICVAENVPLVIAL